MSTPLDRSQTATMVAATPFDLWFERKLQSIYEPVIHEPLPASILAVLKAASKEN